MKPMYVAQRDILFSGRNYAAGEEMPYDAAMTPLWLEHGSVADVSKHFNTIDAEVTPTSEDRAKDLAGPKFTHAQLAERATALGVPAADIKKATSKPKLAALIVAAEDATAREATVTGHLDTEDLSTMTLEEITALAEDMGADITGIITVEDIAAILAAIPVQAPAGAGNGGGGGINAPTIL